jgi:hypothetical protein
MGPEDGSGRFHVENRPYFDNLVHCSFALVEDAPASHANQQMALEQEGNTP